MLLVTTYSRYGFARVLSSDTDSGIGVIVC